MKLRFFAIPALEPEAATDELNRFCAGRRIIELQREFVADGVRSFWSICVGYQDGAGEGAAPEVASSSRGKIDYKEVLNEHDFAVYAALRNLRKTISEQESVPAYALFTNEQLAEMVRRRVASPAALGEIAGVGSVRIEKYGTAFIAALRQALDEVQGEA